MHFVQGYSDSCAKQKITSTTMLLSTSASNIDQICFRKGVEGLIGSALKHTPAKTPKVDCPMRQAVH
jgi:hypothetical protein